MRFVVPWLTVTLMLAAGSAGAQPVGAPLGDRIDSLVAASTG